MDDPRTAKSRTGYIITYAGCPVTWASKMQTEIALSSTEAEYIALSTAMREVKPLIGLIREAIKQDIKMNANQPNVHCKIFEDNSGVIELVNVPKIRPRTKHLNLKYHFFRSMVKDKTISIHYVKSEDQITDLLTKSLVINQFQKLRKLINGW